MFRRNLCRKGLSWSWIVGALIAAVIFINILINSNRFVSSKFGFSRSKLSVDNVDRFVVDTVEHVPRKEHPLVETYGGDNSRGSEIYGGIGMFDISKANSVSDQVTVSAEEFRAGAKTGNRLIDDYGNNNVMYAGEEGRGVIMPSHQKFEVTQIMEKYRVNTLVSDGVPLNRMVPDSRIVGCDALQYHVTSLPAASIIIPFYDEWPSLLLRTVYSIINRTPRTLVKDIVLVDDASTFASLGAPLDEYISTNFPLGLVKLVRVPQRKGLINSRNAGIHVAEGEVLVFFDSHMEVNVQWLEPLLTEIHKNRSTVAMATLDYIQSDSLEYRYNMNYLTRYVWDWRMVFFETFFREDQTGPDTTSPRPGAAMVGAAFAIDKAYFMHLGGYDEGMEVWGGENLEMSWRVWLCGGQLIHVPCSRIGHIARPQPYSFPGGRESVENFNYKRAVEVWMDDYTRFVYYIRPKMRSLDVGDLSSRLALKKRLQCKPFSWYLENVWPELNIYDEQAKLWGLLKNDASNMCLNNGDYLFQAPNDLLLKPCGGNLHAEGFTLTLQGQLRTSLQCAIVAPHEGYKVKIEDCIIGSFAKHDRWEYTNERTLVHKQSGMCLDETPEGPMVTACEGGPSQTWSFQPIHLQQSPAPPA